MFRGFILTLGIVWGASGSAVDLKKGQDYYNLAPHAQYLEDSSHQLEYDDVISKKWDKEFQEHKNQIANFGFVTSAFWFKIPIKSKITEESEWVLAVEYALLDYIDLFRSGIDLFDRALFHPRRSGARLARSGGEAVKDGRGIG